MEHISFLLTIAVIQILGVMSPGPDFFMIMRNSLRYSRRTGIFTAIGLGFGVMVHITYCLAGLALVISQSILLFSILKYLGAAYLIYIGLKSVLAKSEHTNIQNSLKKRVISPLKAIQIGFITNILNPKVTLYFLGLFTIVITPQTPPQNLALASLIIVGITVLWFSAVAIFLTHKRIRAVYQKFQKYINKILGSVLILLGIKIAAEQR